MIDEVFLDSFIQETETLWRHRPILGFGSWRGAHWLPGLSQVEIGEFESEFGVHFPDDFRRLLAKCNGTEYPDQAIREGFVGASRPTENVYSYPRDVALVREAINWLDWENARINVQVVLAEQGYELESEAVLIPIFGHRYLVCGSDPSSSTVLSIVGNDAIVYGANLRTYLETEFLSANLSGKAGSEW